MSATSPHYLLFSEALHANSRPHPQHGSSGGRWKFALEATNGSSSLEAADDEDEISPERLELLAVVRGLEALPQPSRVTLITASRYVCRGLRFGLAEWRENGWQWEHFGQLTPVANADLWQRLDQALRIHDVQIRTLRIDAAHAPAAAPRPHLPSFREPQAQSKPTRKGWLQSQTERAGRWMRSWVAPTRVRAAQMV